MKNSVIEELRANRFVDIQEEICRGAVWRWAILESKLHGVYIFSQVTLLTSFSNSFGI